MSNLYLLSKQNAFNLVVHVPLYMWAIVRHFMVIACPLHGDSAHHMAWQLLLLLSDGFVFVCQYPAKKGKNFAEYFLTPFADFPMEI